MSQSRRHVVRHFDEHGQLRENIFDGSGCALLAKKRYDELTKMGISAEHVVQAFKRGEWRVIE